MMIIVETNFIIELALEQDEAEEVESIVEWAEEERINLAIPAFAFRSATREISEALPATSSRKTKTLSGQEVCWKRINAS